MPACVRACVCVRECVSPSNLQAGTNLVVRVVHLQHGCQPQQAQFTDHTELTHGQFINREVPVGEGCEGVCTYSDIGPHTHTHTRTWNTYASV